MAERFYLHVGAPKAGTTYLQRVLDANVETLRAHGVTVLGPRLDLIHAAMVVREDPRLAELPDGAAQAWSRIVAAARDAPTPVAVASYELFAGVSAEQARAALSQLAGADDDGPQVHVVITARDLGRAVPSAWQEQLKFASTAPLESWQPRPESAGPRAEWGWRTMDPAAVAARWSQAVPPERIHIVTLPRTAGAELWQRFAAACGIEAPVDTEVGRVNESLGAAQAELLRRVNAHLGDRITGARARSVWIRDLLAHGVLARQTSQRPLVATDTQVDDARSRAEAAIAAIGAAGYDVRGDLGDLEPRDGAEGVLPGSVDDAELLAAAVEALADLLVAARDRAGAATEHTSVDGDHQGVGRLARVLGAPARRQVDELRRRIAALETQVQSERALQLRVAELSDVVADLLLPHSVRGSTVRRRAVMDYRRRSL